MNFSVESSDPNKIGYYLLFIFVLLLTYFMIMLISYLFKAKYNGNCDDDNEEDFLKIVKSLTEEQKNLRFKYLIVTTAIRASVWVKAPYIFALYNRLHGFERKDIGILYAIDNASAMITGPILGSFGDIYGRKKLCVLYCLTVIIQICIRITGNRLLAYLAQILTGIGGALIETAFESWLNFEATFLFSNDSIGNHKKNYFLKDIFSK
jgi:predicted MFS family arabinose efflux permease